MASQTPSGPDEFALFLYRHDVLWNPGEMSIVKQFTGRFMLLMICCVCAYESNCRRLSCFLPLYEFGLVGLLQLGGDAPTFGLQFGGSGNYRISAPS
jgi:hypothetical protein